jgi:DHA3 family macrolide efflux protein-like MFS transporter
VKAIPYNFSHWKPLFFTIWSGQAFSLFGSRLVDFALVWYMTTATGSAVVLTTASIVSMLPMILAPIFGSLVDRWKRRYVMIVADGLIAAFTLLIAVLFWSGGIQIWHMYVLLFVRSVAGTVQAMAMMASTSLMVPEENLSRVAGMNQSLNGAMSIAAPPLGALLMSILPIYSILFIDVATACIAILPLVFIRIPEIRLRTEYSPGKDQTEKPNMLKDILQGFQYLLSSKGLFTLLLLVLLLNFLAAPIPILLPLLVTKHFTGGALQLGWLEGASGIGIIVGGLVLSAWGGFKKRVFTILSGAVLFGLSIFFLGAAPAQALWLGVSASFFVGFSGAFTDGPFMAILQTKVAPEIQGRVFSVVISIAKLATPLALLISGQLEGRLGVRFWYLAAGVVIVLVNLVSFRIPVLIGLEEKQIPDSQTAPENAV